MYEEYYLIGFWQFDVLIFDLGGESEIMWKVAEVEVEICG